MGTISCPLGVGSTYLGQTLTVNAEAAHERCCPDCSRRGGHSGTRSGARDSRESAGKHGCAFTMRLIECAGPCQCFSAAWQFLRFPHQTSSAAHARHLRPPSESHRINLCRRVGVPCAFLSWSRRTSRVSSQLFGSLCLHSLARLACGSGRARLQCSACCLFLHGSLIITIVPSDMGAKQGEAWEQRHMLATAKHVATDFAMLQPAWCAFAMRPRKVYDDTLPDSMPCLAIPPQYASQTRAWFRACAGRHRLGPAPTQPRVAARVVEAVGLAQPLRWCLRVMTGRCSDGRRVSIGSSRLAPMPRRALL